MSSPRAYLCLLSALLLGATAFGQVPARRPNAPTPPGAARRGRLEPCWQVAGISPTVIQQRRAISAQARQQIEAVCANASLNAAQKTEEIRQIHEREHLELEALITPEQREAMHACQAERGHTSGRVSAPHPRGVGPCGVVAGRHPFADDEEDEEPGTERPPHERTPAPEKPPAETPKPN